MSCRVHVDVDVMSSVCVCMAVQYHQVISVQNFDRALTPLCLRIVVSDGAEKAKGEAHCIEEREYPGQCHRA